MILVLDEGCSTTCCSKTTIRPFRRRRSFWSRSRNPKMFWSFPGEERWKRKAFQLMTMSDTRRRVVSRLLRSLMLDADRAIQIQPEEDPPISRELLDRLPSEDVYLVLAYVSAGADLLITTDRGLLCAIGEHDDVNCRMRDDFLPGYAAPSHERVNQHCFWPESE